MTPPNPSEAAREAAVKIVEECNVRSDDAYLYIPEVASIIQAAIEAHEKPIREWIMNQAEHLNSACYGPPGEDGKVTYAKCTCGLSRLRSSLHHED